MKPIIEELIANASTDRDSAYRNLFLRALVVDESNFRISPEDISTCVVPTSGRPDSFTLGAFIDERLVGIVSFEREGHSRIKLRHKGLLFRMAVEKEYQGKGIGKALITELLRRVRRLPNLHHINLTVMAHNVAAIALYRTYAFEVYGIEKASVSANNELRDEVLMSLVL